MAKRQHQPEPDDDESIPRASPKRARTADSDDEPPRSRRRDANGRDGGRSQRSQRAAAATQSDEEEELREEDVASQTANGGMEMDDDEFDEIYGEPLRAHLAEMRKHATQGSVADYGIIEYIEMHQFMCHKFLKFAFGPQINFIIGHNGSGKSAVLSAITVALGGKATSTGRGNGLKSFIREGQSMSEVTIHIKNQGEEAYKPQEYGKTIIITRRFGRDGASSWKIRGKDKPKVVSTKKDELAAICDHMNIQVDNPMNVLTQDAARQFLSASAPSDKYKFFLRGTQLQQLSEDYETCLSNIRDTTKLLQVKKEALPDLKARRERMAARYQEAKKAREQKQKAADLKKELAWAHVGTKRAELEVAYDVAAKTARRVPKVKAELDKAQASFDAAEADVMAYEEELNAMPGIGHLTKQKQDLQAIAKENRGKIHQFKIDERNINESVTAIDKQIYELDQKIAEETRRMADQSNGKQEAIARKLNAAKEEIRRIDEEMRNTVMQRKDVGLQYDRLKEEETPLIEQRNRLRNDIGHIDNDIASAKQSEQDALVPYGKNMRTIVDNIKKMRWYGEQPPIGPLGQYVKAKDPARWGDILRRQLQGILCAFAVTDARDSVTLKKLLSDHGNPHIMVITSEVDLFDYSSGEQPEGVHTVLRELVVSDPYVLRVLINQANIERIVLAQTRDEADNILKKLRQNGHGGNVAWANGFVVRVFPEGGGMSTKTDNRDMRGGISLLLTGRDSASEISHLMKQRKAIEEELTECDHRLSGLDNQMRGLRRQLEEFNKREQQLQRAHRTARSKEVQYQDEANEELPVGVQAFEENKREVQEEKENLITQFKYIAEQKAAVDSEMVNIQNQMKEVNELIDDFENKRSRVVSKVEDAAEQRTRAQNAVRHFSGKLKDEEKIVTEKEDAAKLVEEELKIWTEKAAEYCEEVENPRKPDEIKRQLDSVTKALKDRERADGATVEQMAEELNKAEQAYEQAQSDYYSMVKLNKALNNSLLTRLARWQEFRRHIALRCKQVFQYHLSHRGYYGKILFDHVANTLQLKVQTEDQIATQGAAAAEKDPRSLSGGEKSFSTICLLLSLWECIGCPLRCLDEFDVFMDAVNRRISMKMMIDTANNSDKKQYILITPQDMSNVTTGPTVRVHRMIDPERGGGTLPFAS